MNCNMYKRKKKKYQVQKIFSVYIFTLISLAGTVELKETYGKLCKRELVVAS